MYTNQLTNQNTCRTLCCKCHCQNGEQSVNIYTQCYSSFLNIFRSNQF